MATLDNKGTLLKCEFSTGTFTDIANVESFSGPNIEVDHYEVAYLSDDWTTKRPTVLNAGQVQFTLGYDPSNSSHTSLYTMFTGGEVKSFKVVLSDDSDTTFQFDGFVKTFNMSGGTSKDQCKADVTVEISGEVTVA